MYQVKYGAVIGREKRVFLYVPSNNFQDIGFFKPITAPYLTWYVYIKPRHFAKRQCKVQ